MATNPTGPANQIDRAVAAVDFGQPTARKTGRDARWPYVPVIVHGPTHQGGQEQIRGRAYATRTEAVDYARAVIAARRDSLARQLADPRLRALRKQHGLPKDLPVTASPAELTEEPGRS